MTRPNFAKKPTMADLGAPSDLDAPPARPKAAAPPMTDPDQDQDIDTDQDQDAGGPTVSPEAVSYRTADQQCNSCEYMGQDGTCAVLKMPVEESSGCNAHKGGGDQGGDMGDDMSGGDTQQPPPQQIQTRGRLRGDYGA